MAERAVMSWRQRHLVPPKKHQGQTSAVIEALYQGARRAVPAIEREMTRPGLHDDERSEAAGKVASAFEKGTVVRSAHAHLEALAGRRDALRVKLETPVPPPPRGDVAGHVRQQELREYLRSMEPKARSKLLRQAASDGAHEEVLAAVFGAALPEMVGMTSEQVGTLRSQVQRARMADELEELERLEVEVEDTAKALEQSLGIVSEAAGGSGLGTRAKISDALWTDSQWRGDVRQKGELAY